MRLVLDASVTVAWCFEDERTEAVEEVLEAVTEGKGALVPPLWAYEVANVIVGLQRQGRITAAAGAGFLEDLQALAIETDREGDRRVFESVVGLARQYGLTVYDAAYLELAMRRGLPLATLDEGLAHAAREAGVEVVGAGEERHRGRG